MTIIAIILGFLLVSTCFALILLVLVQLPKKDAGAGLAFGGGAADALFGAGSGNALTKITKWAIGIFVVLAIVLGILVNKMYHGNAAEFERQLQQKQNQTPALAPTPAPAQQQSQPANPPLTVPSGSSTTPATGTNAPSK